MSETPYRVADSYGLEKCPHCGGMTAAREHEVLRWVCGVCGRPIVPGIDAAKLDDRAIRDLREAAVLLSTKAAIVRRAVRSMIVVVPLLLLLRADRGLVPLLAIILAFGLNAVLAGTERKKRRASAVSRIEEAWAQAAAVLVRGHGGRLAAKQLAATTRIALPEAEHLLTRLSVDRGRVDLDDQQQLHYRVDVPEPLDSAAPPSASARRSESQ